MLYCTKKIRNVILYSFVYDFCINFKITVSYVISHTYDGVPWNIREPGMKIAGHDTINTVNTFAYCSY